MSSRTVTPRLPRRRLIQTLAVSAASSAAVPSGPPLLPAITLGKHQVTRLVAGYNPIGGHSHSVPKLSAIMRDWFTPERTLEYALACERNGINTWQGSIDKKVFAALRAAWDRGSKLQWICLMHDAEPAAWKEIADLKPIAVVHHGELTDRLYKSGEQAKIRDFLKKAHDFGILAGISSHSPENIARCEDAGWEHDLYMTCFYNIRRDQEKVKAALGDLPVDELYLANDPERMTAVVRQVKRPCLGFKVFAAGRLCNNRASIERALRSAYERIKPGDGLILGMFPMLTDEVAENADLARQILVAS